MYHALTPDSKHLALKIYKTSILVFKDRDKYVTGEYRFRRGYSRRNPRKMVRLWAEKEMRNLKRLMSAGIPCPDPIEVRENVLVMSFVGDKEGWSVYFLCLPMLPSRYVLSHRASPRLKDAQLSASECAGLYAELVLVVRKMFHQCKLVHADLSEYNILYHEGHLWIIDVSQSVEHDHPSAFDFLRNDIKNVEEFFGRLGVLCLGLRRCFDFITKETFTSDREESDEDILRKWLEEEDSRPTSSVDDDASRDSNSHQVALSAHEDSVFLQSFIPRTLNEVYDPERDVEKLNRGEGDGLIYAKTIGLVNPTVDVIEGEINGVKAPKGSVHFDDEVAASSESESSEDDDEDDGLNEGDEGTTAEGYTERKPRGHRHEDRDAKKVRRCYFPILQVLTVDAVTQKSCQGRSERKTKAQNA